MAQTVGFQKELFIMPFDHRGSFQEKLFGIKGQVTPEQTALIASYKKIIYEGFKLAVKAGVPREKAGILTDEQFGSEILRDAKSQGFMTACPAEKSGQKEFDFEYGDKFGEHIEKFDPTFVKVLVRYNPEGDPGMNRRQNERLKRLSDYCHSHGHKFMFELLVPSTHDQLERVGNDSSRYDRELRPRLMSEAMVEIQSAGVEPDLWKLEGLEREDEFRAITETARNSAARQSVGVIVLGRGENAEKVRTWLTAAAKVPGVIGFAVGRTIFWDPLVGVRDEMWTTQRAAEMVRDNYKFFCDLWQQTRRQSQAA